jgi:hypothetical protein
LNDLKPIIYGRPISLFLKDVDENHFIWKIRHRIFDEEAGLKFIKDLKSIPLSPDKTIDKGLMHEFMFALIIYHNQVEFFAKELTQDDWDSLHSIMSELFTQVRRILG